MHVNFVQYEIIINEQQKRLNKYITQQTVQRRWMIYVQYLKAKCKSETSFASSPCPLQTLILQSVGWQVGLGLAPHEQQQRRVWKRVLHSVQRGVAAPKEKKVKSQPLVQSLNTIQMYTGVLIKIEVISCGLFTPHWKVL